MQTATDKPTMVGWEYINGTSLKGYITTTRRHLESLFGPPDEDDRDKVTCQWRLLFPSGVVATIYDWKRYCAMPMDGEYRWHIGGKEGEDTLAEVQAVVGKPATGWAW